jgi:hypothetical protein
MHNREATTTIRVCVVTDYDATTLVRVHAHKICPPSHMYREGFALDQDRYDTGRQHDDLCRPC